MSNAKLYLRRNGSFGSSCDGVADTGHTIMEDSGRFRVYSADNADEIIADNATREEAEDAIAKDWRGRR